MSSPYLGPGGWIVPPAQVSRLRVDSGQTGFFDGREFRTFKELSIPNGTTYVIRAVVPINIVLFGLELTLDNGQVRLGTYADGTAGGTFSEQLPLIPANSMSEKTQPAYTPKVVLSAGGTHTGGIELDVIRVKVENSTGAAASVGNVAQDERGVGAGTYFFRIQNIGTGVVEGTFKARWEERP